MISLVRKFVYLFWLPFNIFVLITYRLDIGLIRGIKGPLKIIGQGKVDIGQGFRSNAGRYFNIIGGDTNLTFLVKKGAEISIGQNCGISNSTIIAHHKIKIGSNVLIGGGVKIYDTNFHSLNYAHRRDPTSDQLNTTTGRITIGNDVFIGAHTIILKDSTIGDRCIIGAGSVVRGTIPSGEIWAGNPAKRVGQK